MTSSLHQHTPSLTVIDPRGLSVRGIAYHRREVEVAIAARVQRQVFNAQGHLVQQWDPRLLELSESETGVQPNQSTRYSLNGQVLLTESVDAGWRVSCHDAAGLLRDSRDGRDTHRRYTYDELKRPVNVFELEPPLCVERFTYAGADEEEARHNRCGKLIRHDDQAGSLCHESFALTGQPLTEIRQFCRSLMPPHWPESEADLEDKTYITHWRHDALDTVIEQIDALEHVQRFEVDVAGQPFASWLDGAALLKSTTYNALGRVEIEQAGNDVTTTAFYSARDGLLSNLKAKRSDGKALQDLHYQYDPVGNITRIEDFAQPVQWFAGQRIPAVSTYAYDTLYQLISATGRENASQTIGPGLPGTVIFGPVDDSRWRTYSQTYSYDSGGNLTRLKHAAGADNTCIREMSVDARSNRSLFKDGSPIDFAKAFDANGNLQALAPGQRMQWDSRNQLQHVTQVQRDDPDGQDDDTETYVYDGGGQRVRKVRRAKTRGGEHISEVRYLPGLEVRCRTVGQQLHVVIAQAGRNSVRLLNWDDGRHQHCYSLSDHLGSSTLELNQSGEVLSQESFYPYGGTAWWAAKSALEASDKVIRYSGKERDATGLYYYGFRYYAPWLQRWINPDPMGDIDGLNVFRMVKNNPSSLKDWMGLNSDDESNPRRAKKRIAHSVGNSSHDVNSLRARARSSGAPSKRPRFSSESLQKPLHASAISSHRQTRGLDLTVQAGPSHHGGSTTQLSRPHPSSSQQARLTIESFPGEKSTLVAAKHGENVFFHYTNNDAHSAIISDGVLNPSNKHINGTLGGRNFGRHYFTDLPPFLHPEHEYEASSNSSKGSPVLENLKKTSEVIFGTRIHGNWGDKMSHVFAINTSGLDLKKSTENEHIYYLETKLSLPLKYRAANGEEINRVILHKKTSSMF